MKKFKKLINCECYKVTKSGKIVYSGATDDIEKIRIEYSNSDIYIETTDDIYIERDFLDKILAGMTTKDFLIIRDDEIIKNNKIRLKIKKSDYDHFIDFQFEENIKTVKLPDFSNILFSSGKFDGFSGRKHLNSVFIRNNEIATTDCRRISVLKTDIQIDKNILIPIGLAKIVSKDCSVGRGEKDTVIEFEEKNKKYKIYYNADKYYNPDSFPEYKEIISRDDSDNVLEFNENIVDFLNEVKKINKDNSIFINSDKIRSGRNKNEIDEGDVYIEMNINNTGLDEDICFKLNYLIDIVKNIGLEKLQLNGMRYPAVVKTNDIVHIVMPKHIN